MLSLTMDNWINHHLWYIKIIKMKQKELVWSEIPLLWRREESQVSCDSKHGLITSLYSWSGQKWLLLSSQEIQPLQGNVSKPGIQHWAMEHLAQAEFEKEYVSCPISIQEYICWSLHKLANKIHLLKSTTDTSVVSRIGVDLMNGEIKKRRSSNSWSPKYQSLTSY